MRNLSAGILVAVLLLGVAHAAPAGPAVAGGLGHIVAAWSCGCGGQMPAAMPAAPAATGNCGCGCHKCGCESCGCRSKCKCCPKVPEYPMVCMHDHRDMHRDLCSRQHAPWW
jgi:hypothetical protein